jgi:hypothetical protein
MPQALAQAGVPLLPPRHAPRRASASRPRAAGAARRSAAPRLATPPAAAPRRARRVAAAADGDEKAEPEREYDEDGLYIGTYSNFWTDPSQLRGVVIFCTVLAGFFSLGNVGAAIVLPLLCARALQPARGACALQCEPGV